MLTDAMLMQWMRGATGGGLDERDVECAGDVSHLQPLLFILARFGGDFADSSHHIYVEIGVADGSTTLPLLKAAAETGGVVHSIDPSGCDRAKELVRLFGYEASWHFHNEKSDEFFSTFHEPINFAFVDGDHSWPAVARDFVNCYKRLRPGGIIVAHDFSPMHLGYPSFEHETELEEQCSNGTSKALIHAWPDLPNVQAVYLGLRSALLLRKPTDQEVLSGRESR